jgi:hypothetical protein
MTIQVYIFPSGQFAVKAVPTSSRLAILPLPEILPAVGSVITEMILSNADFPAPFFNQPEYFSLVNVETDIA